MWRPPPGHVFPKKEQGGNKRSFNSVWCASKPWLIYSPSLDGALCLYCVIFGNRVGSHEQQIKKLYKEPLTFWPSAKSKLDDHENKSGFHRAATNTFDTFRRIMDKPQRDIQNIITTAMASQIEKNRVILKAIAETILFCGRQNIALRGHREQGENGNPGNFISLLKFQANGDIVLNEHIREAANNAKYTSPEVQNDIIECIGEVILDDIIKDIQDSTVFGLIADEATDASNKAQLPVIVRFVDKGGCIREEFLKFVHLEHGCTGKAISDELLHVMTSVNLDMNNCRSQCYDGAGSMGGKFKGSSALIQKEFPLAHYTHCHSHRLNLCIVKACEAQAVRNMMGIVTEASYFFTNSPKRQSLLIISH